MYQLHDDADLALIPHCCGKCISPFVVTLILPVLLSTGCLQAGYPQGVVVGAGFLQKSILFETDRLDQVMEIAPVRTNNKNLLGVISHHHAQLLDLEGGSPPRTIDFPKGLMNPIVVDLDQDGTSQILASGGFDALEVGVLLVDLSGKTIWEQLRPEDYWGPGVSVGDLDRDGKQEIYRVSSRTIERLGPGGRTMWRKKPPGAQYSGLAVYDAIGGGEPFLLALNRKFQAEFYDGTGKLIRTRTLRKLGRSFQVLRWPSGDNGVRLVTWARRSIVVMDLTGRIEFEHAFPSTYPDRMNLKATLVRFREDEPQFLAVMVTFGNYTGRSMVCIFSLGGELIYEEGLGKASGLLATQLPGALGLEQVLLVGDRESGLARVLKYEHVGQVKDLS